MAKTLKAIFLHRSNLEKYMQAINSFEMWTCGDNIEARIEIESLTGSEIIWIQEEDREMYGIIMKQEYDYIIAWK